MLPFPPTASKEEKQKKEQESTFLVFNEDSSTLDEVTFLRTPKRLISVPETISEEVEDSNWRSNFVHDDIKSCYVCDFQCDGLHALTRHLKSHEDPICCKICGTKASFSFINDFFLLLFVILEFLRKGPS